ncbi:MAG: hypothetical protein Q4D81_04510 [Eubacteriales bacterium]|nr:hypothetical protein [Eubacteriales bacterium]
MRTLTFDEGVFDTGNGWVFRKIMNVTLPGLLLAAVLIALINTGLLNMESVPGAVLKLIGILTVVYIIPSVFAFPTVWFLSSGRTRLYRNSTIDLYKKKLVYHKVVSMTMSRPRYTVYSVTQLRTVEVTRRYYILHGAVTNETSGGNAGELKIPVAFENMHLIREMARYRK